MLQSELRSCTATLGLVELLTEDATVSAAFSAADLRGRVAGMVLSVIRAFTGRRSLDIKISNPEQYGFDPKDILSRVGRIATHFAAHPEFASSVAESGYYAPDLLPKCVATLRRLHSLDAARVDALDALANAAAAAHDASRLDAGLENEAPDDFVDPLTCELMVDPVKLPSGICPRGERRPGRPRTSRRSMPPAPRTSPKFRRRGAGTRRAPRGRPTRRFVSPRGRPTRRFIPRSQATSSTTRRSSSTSSTRRRTRSRASRSLRKRWRPCPSSSSASPRGSRRSAPSAARRAASRRELPVVVSPCNTQRSLVSSLASSRHVPGRGGATSPTAAAPASSRHDVPGRGGAASPAAAASASSRHVPGRGGATSPAAELAAAKSAAAPRRVAPRHDVSGPRRDTGLPAVGLGHPKAKYAA